MTRPYILKISNLGGLKLQLELVCDKGNKF